VILVDTSIWIDWSNDRTLPVALELDRLLAADEVATTDIVMAEVLQGARTKALFDDWLDTLDALHYLPTTRDTWLNAAGMLFALMRRGLTTALSDLVVAQIAIENDLVLFATDTDFQRVPGLKLHSIEGKAL
jgi:predicted nucleic acid-binding protein